MPNRTGFLRDHTVADLGTGPRIAPPGEEFALNTG
jgi:hypothetical protein